MFVSPTTTFTLSCSLSVCCWFYLNSFISFHFFSYFLLFLQSSPLHLHIFKYMYIHTYIHTYISMDIVFFFRFLELLFIVSLDQTRLSTLIGFMRVIFFLFIFSFFLFCFYLICFCFCFFFFCYCIVYCFKIFENFPLLRLLVLAKVNGNNKKN